MIHVSLSSLQLSTTVQCIQTPLDLPHNAPGMLTRPEVYGTEVEAKAKCNEAEAECYEAEAKVD